ncbi:hypothetical protein NIES4071_103810 (plasmid) [Calothrix sp. NIES-4071]|nr:hypothetical protein NIES4071_103810 [Calothrix sp. NIES-4071]BAZ64368.1 hypothetical protein NIES4105_101010 [Calothrix sp. NIES-4105]
MEFTTVMQIIDATLYFLIYGGSCFIILAILLDIQTAWINHTSDNINVTETSKIQEIASTHKIEIEASQVEVEIAPIVEDVEIVAPIRKVAAPTPTQLLVAKDSFAISKSSKSASKVRIEDLRQRCENSQIQWRYARINPATNRKRHLTEDEMVAELGI